MAGVGPAEQPVPPGHHVLRLLDAGEDAGGQRADREVAHGAVQRGQHQRGRLAHAVGDAAQQVADLAHGRRGDPVVAGDVADDEVGRAVGGEERVVPVAADLRLVGRRAVAHGDLEVVGLRRLGEQAALERLRHAQHGLRRSALGLADEDALQAVGALGGQGVEDLALRLGDGVVVLPADGQGAEHLPGGHQGQGHPRPAAGVADDAGHGRGEGQHRGEVGQHHRLARPRRDRPGEGALERQTGIARLCRGPEALGDGEAQLLAVHDGHGAAVGAEDGHPLLHHHRGELLHRLGVAQLQRHLRQRGQAPGGDVAGVQGGLQLLAAGEEVGLRLLGPAEQGLALLGDAAAPLALAHVVGDVLGALQDEDRLAVLHHRDGDERPVPLDEAAGPVGDVVLLHRHGHGPAGVPRLFVGQLRSGTPRSGPGRRGWAGRPRTPAARRAPRGSGRRPRGTPRSPRG